MSSLATRHQLYQRFAELKMDGSLGSGRKQIQPLPEFIPAGSVEIKWVTV
jgi:hypothetical protein